MRAGEAEPARRRPAVGRWVAAVLGAFGVAEVIAGIALSRAAGWSMQDAIDSFAVTNGLMGLTFAVCGAVIAWYRPGNPIGWLFVADGIGHATTAVGAPLTVVLHDASAPISLQRLLSTVISYSWPWSIALFLPLALLLFPDGKLASPRWRTVAIAIVVTSPLFAAEMGAGPSPAFDGGVRGYLTISSYDALQPLWTATEIRGLIAYALAITSLVIRYRRSDETRRRQLLWLLLAAVIVLTFMTP